jgi:ribonuclease D
MHWPFPRADYLDHDKDFYRLVDKLSKEPLIAVDTESNSLYAYRERVCLVQLSTRNRDYIVDPLRIADMSPLGMLLANPSIVKVFHAAEYDLICLKRDYSFTFNNLFDTMLAARICGRKAAGLDRLLADELDVKADKSHQRDDWGQRPLTEEGLLYAQMDTHYLPMLHDELKARLESQARWIEAQEAFEELCQVEAVQHSFDPDGYWRIGIPAGLNRRQLAILREVYYLRESLAEERDVPPFKIMNDRVLVSVAEASPARLKELTAIKGLGTTAIKRYGTAIIQAVKQGKHARLPKQPRRPADVEPQVAERFSILRDWRRLRAEQRGVDSDVILSRDALWGLAKRAPDSLDDMQGIPGLGPWRLATYGPEILDVMKKSRDGK